MRQLRGLKLIAESGRYAGPVAFMWFETLLMREGLGRKEDFFGTIEDAGRTSQAVLGVFFGEFDACLVTHRSFETMKELNPQIGEELTALNRSPALMREMVCGRKGYDETRKQVLMDGAFKLHHYVKGQQILDLFGLDRVVPFDPAYLDPIIGLVEEYNDLRGRSAGEKRK